MATPDGKVSFEAGGKAYTLQFTTNALCALEDKTDKTTLDVALALKLNPPMAMIRAMFWAAFGGRDITLAGAGDLIDAIGKARAIELAREAFGAAFPSAEEAGAGDDTRPPVAAAG